jgi:hypothetical protein
MKIRAQKIANGLHPSEVVVAVATTSGQESLVVNSRSFTGDSLEIGYPINQERNNYLVELPHETESGSWRVWVSDTELTA